MKIWVTFICYIGWIVLLYLNYILNANFPYGRNQDCHKYTTDQRKQLYCQKTINQNGNI